MASAGARASNGGLGTEPPAGVQGAQPPVAGQGSGRSPLKLVVVADLTEATGQRRTFDTAAILTESKRLNGSCVPPRGVMRFLARSLDSFLLVLCIA